MGAMSELDIVVQDLRALTAEELADLVGAINLERPSGPHSPGTIYLSDLRDGLVDRIEKAGGAPDPDGVFDIPGSWTLIPVDRHVWDVFLDLGAYGSDHASWSRGLTTDAARAVLARVGHDFWRELLEKHVPARFYL